MQLSWLRRKDATLEELEQQYQAAQQAHGAALAAVTAAQSAFDESGDDSSAKALLKSREAVELAAEHLGRATRLLEAAQAREAAAERERMVARAAEIRDLVRHDGVERELAPLRAREVDLLLQVVQVRRERQLLQDRLTPLLGEYAGIAGRLGQDPTLDHRVGNCDNYVATEQALRAHAADYPDGDPCRALLREVAPGLRSYSRQ